MGLWFTNSSVSLLVVCTSHHISLQTCQRIIDIPEIGLNLLDVTSKFKISIRYLPSMKNIRIKGMLAARRERIVASHMDIPNVGNSV